MMVDYSWPISAYFRQANGERVGDVKEKLDAWIAEYVSNTPREKTWNVLQKDAPKLRWWRKVLAGMIFTAKWTWPVILLAIVAQRAALSALILSLVLLPVQATLLVWGAFKLYDLLAVVSAYALMQEKDD